MFLKLLAEKINHMQLEQLIRFLAKRDDLPAQADVLMVLGSSNLEVPQAAAELYHLGISETILICGGVGRLTGDFPKPEAQVYADTLESFGVPRSAMLLDDRSTNTGENILFGLNILKENQLQPRSIILMQTPVLQYRAYLTLKKHAPELKIYNYAGFLPELDPENIEHLQNLALGEMQRLLEYGPQGKNFIAEPQIPQNVLDAYNDLKH